MKTADDDNDTSYCVTPVYSFDYSVLTVELLLDHEYCREAFIQLKSNMTPPSKFPKLSTLTFDLFTSKSNQFIFVPHLHPSGKLGEILTSDM